MVPFRRIVSSVFSQYPPYEADPSKIRRARHSSLIERTRRLANAFRFGLLGGSMMGSTPPDFNVE